jgi:hypothetical protein
MSKSSYIIKFDNKADYETHKEQLVATSEYTTIDTGFNFWVLHYLTQEEYEKIKSYGIHITLDAMCLKTC